MSVCVDAVLTWFIVMEYRAVYPRIVTFGCLMLSKTANFPFRTMDYSPWSAKNLINQNQLKKFMQVGIDVTCIHTNFGGCGLSGFGDIAAFKNGQFSLLDHGLQSMVSKKFN